MLVATTSFPEVVVAIKDEGRGAGQKNVQVFVALDGPDSILTTATLTDIFNHESIIHSLTFVTTYEQIKDRFNELKLNATEEFTTLILINCGATEDIRKLLELATENLRIVILDSHRPIHPVYNNSADFQLCVIVDETDPIKSEDVPEYSPEDEEEDEESGEEQESDQEEASQSDEEQRSSGSKRRGSHQRDKQERKRQRLEARNARKRLIEQYFSKGNGYGKPSAMIVADLAHKMMYDNETIWWRAIVSYQDYREHMRLNTTLSRQYFQELQGHIRSSSAGPSTSNRQEGCGNRRAQAKLVIVEANDFKFQLLRHWNLFDSMRYSTYTAARFKTWLDSGVDTMKAFLARLGLEPKVGKGPFKTMHPALKDRFQPLLEKHCSSFGYGLNYEKLVFKSFCLNYAHEVDVSASDAAYVINAILADHRHKPEQAYWRVLTAMSFQSGLEEWKRGLALARELQKAVVDDGGVAMHRNQVEGIAKDSSLWLLNMMDRQAVNQDKFYHPINLITMGMFIRESLIHRLGRRKPMVLVGPADENDKCFVVGIHHTERDDGFFQANKLTNIFAEVLMEGDVSAQSSLFDNAVLLLDKSEINTFVDELKYFVLQNQQDAAAA